MWQEGSDWNESPSRHGSDRRSWVSPDSVDLSLQHQHEKLANLRKQLEVQHEEQKRQLNSFQANIEKQLAEVHQFQLNTTPTGRLSLSPNTSHVSTPTVIERAKAVLRKQTDSDVTLKHSPQSPPTFQPMRRKTLVEKHRKHIDDLKEYYEREIRELNASLEETRLEVEDEQESPMAEALQDEIEGLKLTNELLHQKLMQTERSSNLYESAVEELKGSLSLLEQNLERARKELVSSEQTVTTLRHNIQELKREKQEKDGIIDRMNSEDFSQRLTMLQRLRWAERPENVISIILDECKGLGETVCAAEEAICRKLSKENEFADNGLQICKVTLRKFQDDFAEAVTALEQRVQTRGEHLQRKKLLGENLLPPFKYQTKHTYETLSDKEVKCELNEVSKRKWLQPSEDNVFYYTAEKRARQAQSTTSPIIKAHQEFYEINRMAAGAVAAVQLGRVVGAKANWREKNDVKDKKEKEKEKHHLSDRTLQKVVKLEKQLADLTADKNQVERLLNQFSSRGKPLYQVKKEKTSLEGHLERTTAEIGFVRMKLGKLNAIKAK
eukprot:m.104616 g.104616  ORF g.104616 m.104616 type:complete len:554 (+) comp37207_c0_seq3:43-1704(+)